MVPTYTFKGGKDKDLQKTNFPKIAQDKKEKDPRADRAETVKKNSAKSCVTKIP